MKIAVPFAAAAVMALIVHAAPVPAGNGTPLQRSNGTGASTMAQFNVVRRTAALTSSIDEYIMQRHNEGHKNTPVSPVARLAYRSGVHAAITSPKVDVDRLETRRLGLPDDTLKLSELQELLPQGYVTSSFKGLSEELDKQMKPSLFSRLKNAFKGHPRYERLDAKRSKLGRGKSPLLHTGQGKWADEQVKASKDVTDAQIALKLANENALQVAELRHEALRKKDRLRSNVKYAEGSQKQYWENLYREAERAFELREQGRKAANAVYNQKYRELEKVKATHKAAIDPDQRDKYGFPVKPVN